MVRIRHRAIVATAPAHREAHLRLLVSFALLALAVLIAGCGSTAGERGATGAGIGAGIGAGGAAITGGSPLGGALVGGAVGGATGALTSEEDIDLGDPFWR